MSDKTKIEWADAMKACSRCRQAKRLDAFSRDSSRIDGYSYVCKACKNGRARQSYKPRPRPAPGRRFVAARNGDQQQARRRIDHLINIGLLPDPNDMPCADCEHVYTAGERRHEYDHHLGYAAEHHEDVEAVCTTCHHARETQRRAA